MYYIFSSRKAVAGCLEAYLDRVTKFDGTMCRAHSGVIIMLLLYTSHVVCCMLYASNECEPCRP